MSSQYIIRVPAQFKVDERTPPKKHVTKMPAKPSMSLNSCRSGKSALKIQYQWMT